MSLKRNIRILTWFNFLTDFKLYAPVAIIYFSNVSHSYALGATVFSITMVSAAIFDVPAGIYSDIIGRKRTVVLGALFAVLCTIFYAIGLSFWFLAIGAVFEGLSRAFYSGNNSALLHNILSEEGLVDEFHSYSGRLGSMFQLALGISALLGGFIANWSFPALMWLSVLPQIGCLLLATLIIDSHQLEEQKENILTLLKNAIKGFKENNNLRLLTISGMLDYGLGETSYQFQAAFYQTIVPIWFIGVAKTLSGILAAVSFYISGKVIDRFGALKVVLFRDVFTRIVNLISLIIPTKISPVLISSTSLAFGVGTTAQGALLQKEFTERQRATIASLNSFGNSITFSIALYLTGLIANKYGPFMALLATQVFLIPSDYYQFKFLARLRKAKKFS